MSVYPQTRFGQVAYPPPTYHQPPPPLPQYHYAQPPPQPQYYIDPDAFRRDYVSRLTELTVNSRPIIQSLSMLAQDYSRWANIVAQCIESHIRRVPPWMKLPAFYLLDAVSKNVFEPYARNFSPLVVPLFLDTYGQVDQSTRNKMEEMLLTWRTGAPTGRELFGVVAQLAIEQGIWGSGSSSEQSNISKSQVLSELEFTVSQKERTLQVNPYDSATSNQLSVLYQLRKLVEAGVMQDELRQILGQLRALSRTSSVPISAPQSYNTSNTSSAGPSTFASPPPTSSYSHSQPSHTVSSASYPASLQPSTSYHQGDLNPTSVVSSVAAPRSVSATVAPPAPGVSSIANLFNALVKAGVVSATPTPPGVNVKSESQSHDPLREGVREYRRCIMSRKIKLSSSELSRNKPQIVDLLYRRLTSQCKQCGMRFQDSSVGKKKMEDHLDMHFRQNRKASQNIGRGHSRSWFIALEDWIHDVPDAKGKGRADRQLGSKAAAAEEQAKREAELRALYVVVPPGDEAKSIACPVCKELLKSEFLEDDEEWVWKNAIKKEDRIYHATCHAEALSSTNNLAARLRIEEGRSRSRTPEVSVRTTPPKVGVNNSVRTSLSPSPASKVAGNKRKADSLLESDEGKPPLKRVDIRV